jgi:NitT/TauT family transport system permease protein
MPDSALTDQLVHNGKPPSAEPATDSTREELAGLDALELASRKVPWTRRAWSATWPKVMAIAIGIGLWQLVVWSGWKPTFVLASPLEAWDDLWAAAADGTLWEAIRITMQRAVVGFSAALVIGVAIGLPVSRSRVLRAGVGSLITGLQTMPSIAWFPLALLIFKISDAAIMFVVILGAAPSIANGLIAGVDQIPPLLLRAGRALGARGIATYRHIVLPAALPGFVAGLKQGWAFAWRSLMAGELIVLIPEKPSVGSQLNINRGLSNSSGVIAWMIVILIIGVVVDALLFGTAERAIRRRRGLLEAGA